MKKILNASLVLALSLSVVLAGCGKNEEKPAGEAATGGAKSDMKIGMVTDVGGVNDKSFNQSAWEALKTIEKDTGAKATYLQSKSKADYTPNLNKYVKGGYALTWGIGFDLGADMKTVADQNPDAKLAIIDAVVDSPNVQSVTFSEHEGAFLVGVVAAKMTKTGKVGFVGGAPIPVITRFQAGFNAGVAAVDPKIKVDNVYAGAFDKPDQGKVIASNMYNSGVDIVFHAAGATGTGVFNEATARVKNGEKVWVIGVDKDQSLEFGDEVTLTSMVKGVDAAVQRVSKEVIDGTFKGGTIELGLKDDGVGIAKTSDKNVPADVLALVEDYKAKIISGEIKVPQEVAKK
ncbi:BMP family lipoprotein [Paenibacillus macquariensis]|uniref:Basic membrane protein A n=1 Tax=Paenibacillus macquariensis TaxID=948756 RepID=A0ABY1JRV0_9BACL|nr:BMP family ABC transporter substrate-binding protein [Paenibacillus macquariensis]MEC0092831.1 BMP family ABC transporter substrate-binding protein [Paenibacillus macquariensis]OAB36211.1 BMP family ABC transporter substrate-binding protein [Paenibacillus macquariensis subsp. macquariensis]SIQ67096.1 basic membrane protein A [Paenibacillus macquariensis]